MQNKKLLFIGNTRLGDCILSTGLLEDLCKYHNAKATVICGYLGVSVFKECPFVERIISLKKQKYSYHWFELWKEIRKSYWDVLCDLRGTPVAWLVRAKKRLILKKNRNFIEHRLNGYKKINPYERKPLPKIWFNDNTRNKSKMILDGKKNPYLVIGPTANWEAKVWPTEYFIQLSKNLISNDFFNKGNLILVGGPGEEQVGEEIKSQLQGINIIDFIGKPILPTAAIMSFSSLYIGNDSGLMHLSAAVGIPTIGLFGPTDDRIYAPMGKNTMVIRTPETPEELMSDPDFDHRKSKSLMRTLSVESVESKAIKMLEKIYNYEKGT